MKHSSSLSLLSLTFCLTINNIHDCFELTEPAAGLYFGIHGKACVMGCSQCKAWTSKGSGVEVERKRIALTSLEDVDEIYAFVLGSGFVYPFNKHLSHGCLENLLMEVSIWVNKCLLTFKALALATSKTCHCFSLLRCII